MPRVKLPTLMFLSKGERGKARKAWKKMAEDHKKFAKLMGQMAGQMLKGAKRDNHIKG